MYFRTNLSFKHNISIKLNPKRHISETGPSSIFICDRKTVLYNSYTAIKEAYSLFSNKYIF